MNKTLADYIPMLESIQGDPENVLDPDYVNARITYKNRDLMLMLDSAGVNLELMAPKDYRFSVSDFYRLHQTKRGQTSGFPSTHVL